MNVDAMKSVQWLWVWLWVWPLVLWRVMTPPAPPREFRATHRRVWLALSVILPLLVLGAMAIRQNGPSEAAPVRLSSP